MINTDEMKMWEDKNKQYSQNIEQTKQMQEESGPSYGPSSSIR